MDAQNIAKRLKHWRTRVVDVPLREVAEKANAYLPEESRIQVSTLSNYESSETKSGKSRPPPRGDFLAALKKAYPDLNLEWLLLGTGEATVSLEEARRFSSEIARLPEAKLENRMPTAWLGEHLPSYAMILVANFLKEAEIATHLVYGAACARGETPAVRASTVHRRIERRLGEMLELPFEGDEAFFGVEELTSEGLTTYVTTVLASIRPIVRPLRDAEARER